MNVLSYHTYFQLAGESTMCLMIIRHILGCPATTKMLQSYFLLKVIVTLCERGAQIGKWMDFQKELLQTGQAECQESATGGRGEIEVVYWICCWQTVFYMLSTHFLHLIDACSSGFVSSLEYFPCIIHIPALQTVVQDVPDWVACLHTTTWLSTVL